jgi:methylmalonyl-CoA mutase N-terminal domain/subunit
MGGIVEAVRTGAIQAEVARQAYRFEQRLAGGDIRKVGVNCYVGEGTSAADPEVELYRFDPRVAEAQVARLHRVRRERDGGTVETALRRLRDEARGRSNLMPALMEAVTAYATLGEIAQAMKDVFGEHKEPVKW